MSAIHFLLSHSFVSHCFLYSFCTRRSDRCLMTKSRFIFFCLHDLHRKTKILLLLLFWRLIASVFLEVWIQLRILNPNLIFFAHSNRLKCLVKRTLEISNVEGEFEVALFLEHLFDFMECDSWCKINSIGKSKLCAGVIKYLSICRSVWVSLALKVGVIYLKSFRECIDRRYLACINTWFRYLMMNTFFFLFSYSTRATIVS